MNNMAFPPPLLPGIWDDLPNDAYHADRSAVSSSALKLLLKSPAHFRVGLDLPRVSTVAKDFGTAIHTALLEPERYREEYVVKPVIDRRTKAGRELADTINQALVGKTQISQEGQRHIEAIVASAKAHPRVKAMLSEGHAERSFVWVDEETGVLCKVRPDWLSSTAIWDLKSAADASRQGFSRATATYYYHLSAAFYVEGVGVLTGLTLPWYFVAMEKEPPYATAVYEASRSFLESGRKQFRRALRLLQQCRERDEWPSYQADGEAQSIDLPPWAA